jgi:cytochrome c biogenesis protein CcdA
MQDWVNSILVTDEISIIVVVAVFFLGAISVFTCACNFAVIGSVVGYTGTLGSTGNKKIIITSSIFFLLGIVVAMSIIGSLISYVGGFFVEVLGDYWKIGVGIILILFGVYIIDILPFKIPKMSFNFQNNKTGIIGTILFGIAIGGFTAVSNICCNPIYPIVIAAIFVKGNMLWGLFMLFFYALGYGGVLALAMVGIGLGIGKLSLMVKRFANFIKYAGGITLILFGIYLLIMF